MVELVTGGSGSGKSEYAESRVMAHARACPSLKKYYLATMIPYGKEGKERIERHKKLRKDKGFITLEHPFPSGDLEIKEKGIVLVECLGNLTANEMFSSDSAGDSGDGKSGAGTGKKPEGISGQVLVEEKSAEPVEVVAKNTVSWLEELIKNPLTEHCILVTNNVFEDGIEYDESTRAYMKALASINIEISAVADRVTEVVCGLPLVLKE